MAVEKRKYEKWLKEFRDLGEAEVRHEMRGWEADKKRAARDWLDHFDTHAFGKTMEKLDEAEESSPRKTGVRGTKLFIYGGGAVLLAVGLLRLLRIL